MTPNTKNKIYLCWNCLSPLTGDEMQFCPNDGHCEEAWRKTNETRDPGYIKQWVYLNKAAVDVARGEGIRFWRLSGFIHTGHDMMAVALYDKPEIESITDSEFNTYDAYWRPIPPPGQSPNLEPHNAEQMRREGLLGYLCDHFGIRTERQIAEAIAELVKIEGHVNPLSLINTL